MIDEVKVSVIQSKITMGEKEKVLEKIEGMIDQSIESGSNLICLPEAFTTGFDFPNLKKIAEEIPGPTTEFLGKKAKEGNTFIIGGIIERDESKIYSSSVLIGPSGSLIGKYRRVHLVDIEHNFFASGSSFEVYDTDIGKIGLIMGYDLNFPESCRGMFLNKVEIIVCPILSPMDYLYPMQLLARARATENYCYFILASSIGENIFAKLKFMGHSMIIGSPIFISESFDDAQERPEIEILQVADYNEQIISSTFYIKELRNTQKYVPHYENIRMKEAYNLSIS